MGNTDFTFKEKLIVKGAIIYRQSLYTLQ